MPNLRNIGDLAVNRRNEIMAVSDQEARELIAMFDSCDPFKSLEKGDDSKIMANVGGNICVDSTMDPAKSLPVWNKVMELMEREHNYRDQGLHPDIDARLPYISLSIGEGLYYFGAYDESLKITQQIASKIFWRNQFVPEYALVIAAQTLYAQGKAEDGKKFMKLWLKKKPDWGYGWLAYLRLLENNMNKADYKAYVLQSLQTLRRRNNIRDKELILPAAQNLLKGRNPYRLEFLGKNVSPAVAELQEPVDQFQSLFFMSLRVTDTGSSFSFPLDSPAGKVIHLRQFPSR